MTKSLVIVESPNKVATIKKYLGDDYIVNASVGHIRDLVQTSDLAKPLKSRKISLDEKLDHNVLRMGINPENWDGQYIVVPEKKNVVAELKKLAKQCDKIYLATDLDREGEAIAWHIQQVLGDKYQYERVIFNEITKDAITKAFQNPTTINLNRVNAQQTRRFLDRMVGFLLTPLLWKKAGKGLSAGRVQSVATRLIVERENEIRKFIPTEYWKISGEYNQNSAGFAFELVRVDKNKLTTPEDKNPFYIANEQQAQQITNLVDKQPATISKVEVKDNASSPKAPFTTSTLQQSASTSLGFSIKRTMMIAQNLYEMGLITYMRTDSTSLSPYAVNMAKDYILREYGEKYYSPTPRVYHSNNANSQEAHEAIRPTSLAPQSHLTGDALKLYLLIRQQFLASQMADAVHLTTNIEASVTGNVNNEEHEYSFKASQRLLKFAGFHLAFGQREDDISSTLGDVFQVGNVLQLQGKSFQNFTQPPARYTEASFVKELEKRSIGRPSTYVTIVNTIQDRGYAYLENKRFYATKIGEITVDCLSVNFNELLEYEFTADMEQNLDLIATGEKNWKAELNEFWDEFKQKLIVASKPANEGGMPEKQLVPTDYLCPKCGKHHMGLNFSKAGNFLVCQGKNEKSKEDICRNIIRLMTSKEFGVPEENNQGRCEKCGSILETYYVNSNTRIHICSNIATCDYNRLETGNFVPDTYRDFACDKCGHTMELKFGPFGKYLHCSECNNSRRILANGDIAPPKGEVIEFPELPCEHKGSYFVLRNSSRGYFLGANNFPTCRETKRLEVAILQKFADRLPEEMQYLATAPLVDDMGNVTVVRYSLKEQQSYIGSFNADTGKFTKYKLNYNAETSKWEVESLAGTPAKKEAKKKATKTSKSTKALATATEEIAKPKTSHGRKSKALASESVDTHSPEAHRIATEPAPFLEDDVLMQVENEFLVNLKRSTAEMEELNPKKLGRKSK